MPSRPRVRAAKRAPGIPAMRQAAARAAPKRAAARAAPKRKGTPRPVPAHRSYTPELIEIVRRRYEETPEPVITIGADLGIHPSSVHRMAKSRGWVRRSLPPPRGVSAAMRLAEQARVLADGVGGVIADTPPDPSPPFAALTGGGEEPAASSVAGIGASAPAPPEPSALDRLERAVLAELATVEAMRAGLGPVPQKPRDAERTVRTLGLLVQTLQHLLRLRAALALGPQSDRGPNPDDDDMPADIDEFRHALARRIEAFVKSRTDSDGADRTAAAAVVDEIR